MKNKFLIISVGSGLIGIGLMCMTFMNGTSYASAVDEKKERVVRPVPVMAALQCQQIQSREFPGVVRACKRVDMGFNIGGIITELQAKEGKRVRQGEVLAKLDSRDALNDLASAEAVLNEADNKYQRAKILFEKKIISKNTLDSSLAAWEIAKAKLGVSKKNMADTVLVAPFDGVIAARYAENFERIAPGQKLISIQDITTVEVVIQIPQSLIANGGIDSFLRSAVKFAVDSEDKYYECAVSEFRSAPDSSTRTYDIILALNMPQEYSILPGMAANVKIDFATANDSLSGQELIMVPVEALWQDNNGKTNVWVIPDTAGSPVSAEVVIEEVRGAFARVYGGIKVGQNIAIAGINSLHGNMLVRPKDTKNMGLKG